MKLGVTGAATGNEGHYAARVAAEEGGMKTWERRLVMAGLAIAGLLFLVAAVRPALQGGSLNVTFLLLGIVLVVGAIAAWRRFTNAATPGDTSSKTGGDA